MMSRGSAWFLRSIILLPAGLGMAISNFHILLFRPETFREILLAAVSSILALTGLLCIISAPISLIRDFSKLTRRSI
jgi:hypothetical protein